MKTKTGKRTGGSGAGRGVGGWMTILAILVIALTFLGTAAPVLADDNSSGNDSGSGNGRGRGPGNGTGRGQGLGQIRQRIQMNLQDARERYAASFAKLANARSQYAQVQGDFMKARNDYRKAHLGGNASNFNDTAYLDKAKGYLNTSAEYVLAMLNHTENEVNLLGPDNMTVKNGTLTLGDLKDQWLATLDAQKANVTAIEADIASATTRDQLAADGKALQASWNQAKNEANKILGLLWIERTAIVDNGMEQISGRLNSIEQSLKTRGRDTPEISGNVTQYNSLLSDASSKFDLARADYSAGNTDAAKAAVKAAQKDLNDAKQALRSLVGAVKGA